MGLCVSEIIDGANHKHCICMPFSSIDDNYYDNYIFLDICECLNTIIFKVYRDNK